MDLKLLLNSDSSLQSRRHDSGSNHAISTEDAELAAIFSHYLGEVPYDRITEIARQRRVDREVIRVWFHNKRVKEANSLVRRYKHTKSSLLRTSKVQFMTFEEACLECQTLIDRMVQLHVVSNAFLPRKKKSCR